MDDELVPAVDHQHHGLQQPTRAVEAETELPRGAVIVQILDPDRPRCSLDGVLGVDPLASARRGGPSRRGVVEGLPDHLGSRRALACRSGVHRGELLVGESHGDDLGGSSSAPGTAAASSAHAWICSSVTGTPSIVSSPVMRIT
jgi:hypothetical protein